MDQPDGADWLAWARRVFAIASTGRHYCRDGHDRERYEELGQIAAAMLEALAERPVGRVRGLFADFGARYATPIVDVRGAVVRDGRVLLVREKGDGRWALPGGYADIGYSPRENVEREVLEEGGIRVAAVRLIAVRHKARHPYRPDIRDFYKLLFLCRPLDDSGPQGGLETSDAAFFGPDELPPLSRARTIEADIAEALAAHADPARLPTFD